MQTKKLMSMAVVTLALFTGFGFMQKAEAGFGIKMPKIGVVKGGGSTASPVEAKSAPMEFKVVDANGAAIKEDWRVFSMDQANPVTNLNDQTLYVKATSRMLVRSDGPAAKVPVPQNANLLIFVRYHGWYLQKATGNQCTIVASKTYPRLYNITFNPNM